VLFEELNQNLVDLTQAATWASHYTKRAISATNISYLIQYGRIQRVGINGRSYIDKTELQEYYDSIDLESQWKQQLGDDVNWQLSFVEFREKERTKHVHRLHPYKGKFIPQLVEYFLDEHTDDFKREVYFAPGDIVLDPFCGSGTTLVQANELGVHAIGIDVSAFNCVIANTKTSRYDLNELSSVLMELTTQLEHFQHHENNESNRAFEDDLSASLAAFNAKYFARCTAEDSTRKTSEFISAKETEFLTIFTDLKARYKIQIEPHNPRGFLDEWLLPPVRSEVEFLRERLKKFKNHALWNILTVILSRAVRSSRATSHADLGTLKTPVRAPYYCRKHNKICKPPLTILNWWKRYAIDTVQRLEAFDKLRTDSYQVCLHGDSRNLSLGDQLPLSNVEFAKLVDQKQIRGIFSSPPYVGVIDYHEQHAYAYELFDIERSDQAEIGPLMQGQGKHAREMYTLGIANVLRHNKQFLKTGYDVFLVANDKYNLYAQIAELAQMQIVNTFKRPVLNRVEKDRSRAYSETIFHLKEL